MKSTKAYNPTLYPKDLNPVRRWFIKYQVDDWIGGGFKYEKYTGLLNREPDIAKRHELAMQYIEMLARGDTMPQYQGCRTMPVKVLSAGTTNVISCCKRFLEHAKNDDKAPATIAQYKSKLNIFYQWLNKTDRSQRAIGGLDELDCQDFMLYLKTDKQLCNHTWNGYKTLLARIWNDYRKYIPTNPWREIKARKNNTKHLLSYPAGLQQRITETMPVYDAQLWLFMQFIYYTGIRPHQELRLLQVKHLNLQTGIITVPAEIAKNHKQRQVNIYYKLLQQLTALGYQHEPPEHYLFSYKGIPGPRRTGKNYFGRKWEKYRKAFAIDDAYKLYGSKHTGGKKLAKQTNMYIAKEHYGHSSYDVTSHYVNDLDKNELKFLQDDFPEFG